MILQDRFTRGFLAGVIGGMVAFPWGLISKYILKFADLLYADFASILIYGKKATTLIEIIYAQMIVFGFFGLCGIVFIFLIPYITSLNLILKGFIWGAFVFFFSYVVTFLFKVPGLELISVNTSISNLIGGLIWGSTLAIATQYLDKKAKHIT